MIKLFKYYSHLKDKLPYVPLGDYPTPIQKLDRLGKEIDIAEFYIKRDDLSGKLYGGNKIRKLEFLLGQALRTGAKEVLTFGSAGSNHALATAIYAKQIGLKSISLLIPQTNAHYVRSNLLMSHYSSAELHHYRNMRFLLLGNIYQRLRHRLKSGKFPKIIPLGGSSPLGNIGYINAAFELRQQIMEGKMPEPDFIYVALGTMGTAVGLMLGLKAAKLKTRVISVLVADETFINLNKMSSLFSKTNALVHTLDPSFPKYEFSIKEQHLRRGFYGRGYASFTKEAINAIERIEKSEGIKLDGTYTGKALAALIADGEKQCLKDKVVLFWHTCNSKDLSNVVSTVDYRQLPRSFHRYFEKEVQPLDRNN